MIPRFQLHPDSASTFSSQVDALYFFLVALTVFFTVLIAALVVAFAIKFRRRSDDEIPQPFEGALHLEVLWTVIPLGIVMVIFGWSAKVYMTLSRPPDNATTMYVTGKQWMWKIQHPTGVREINELHLPVGQPVKLIMTSEDVIHSFYIPAFRQKMDVLPGRYTTMWFEPTKTGKFHLFCAEYCGTKHSGMIGTVYVMDPTEYASWLSGGRGEGTLAQRGEKLFQDLACTNCHTVEAGAQGRCPNLRGAFGAPVQLASGQTITFNEGYIRESILNPDAKVHQGFEPVMPTFQGLVSEEGILELIEYIKSIGPVSRSTGQAGGAVPAGQRQATPVRPVPSIAGSQRENR
jgi:cytochrome c oxidase subunit 2